MTMTLLTSTHGGAATAALSTSVRARAQQLDSPVTDRSPLGKYRLPSNRWP